MVAVPLKVTSTKKKGDYEVRSYSVTKLQDLGQGATLRKLITLFGVVGAPMDMMDEGTALGYFNGTAKFRVAFKDDKPVAVHMKGETEDEEVFNKKFGKKGVFGKSGGSGLDIQSGRTKRNRRGRKHRKLRKLTTRRR
jgi:hypothetical protein